MDNDITIIQSSVHRSARHTAVHNIHKVKESHEHPTNRLDPSWFVKYQRPLIACAILSYVLIAMTTGVLAIYFGSQNSKNRTCSVTFTPTAQRANGYDSRPRHVAIGDFDQNSHLDLAVANSCTGNIGIYLNHANGTFDKQRLVPTGPGSRPYGVIVEDFNNDKKLDLVVARYGVNSLGVYLGDGKENFTEHTIISLDSSRPLSLAAGDFNNDSMLDIAVVNDGTLTVTILTGHNNGSFRLQSVHEMGFDSMPQSIAVADLNGDRQTDLAIVNYGTSELVILVNDRNGSFMMSKYSTGSGSHPSSVAIGDFNNDEQLDIATANSVGGSIGIFLGNGDGTFRKYLEYSTGLNSRPQSLGVVDMNNDTVLDIVVVDASTNDVLVLKGNGTGNFSVITTHSSGFNSQPLSLVVGDFDNDHRPDIAVANNATNSIFLLRSFLIYPVASYVNYSTGGYSEVMSVVVADLNEDGCLDLIVPDYFNDYLYIFLNVKNGTFKRSKRYYTGDLSGPYFVTSGDVNNDHHVDVVVTLKRSDQIQIFLGFGNGTFRKGKRYSTKIDSELHKAELSDLNSDGNIDIVVSLYATGNVGIFFGFGDGNFTKMNLLSTTLIYQPKCVSVGDFNNDNASDIIVPNINNRTIAVFLGYGNGSFGNPLAILVDNDRLSSMTIGDVNNDNQSDIVYTDILFSHIGVLLGNGDGTFGRLTRYLTARNSDPSHVTLGYYNDDTFLDIVVSSYIDRSISVFMGMGNGSFGTLNRLSLGYEFLAVFAMFVDLNKDNRQEIIVSYSGDECFTVISIHYEADFKNESNYPTGSGPHPYSIAVQDLDANKQSDLVIANSGNDNIELLHNYNNGIFIHQTIFSLQYGSHPQSVILADFNKDNRFDLAVLNSWNDNINVFMGLSNRSFDAKMIYMLESGSSPNSMIANDLNKDGRMDLIIANQAADNIAIFLAFDFLQFTSHHIHMSDPRSGPAYVITADFNNDHQLDVAVSITNLDKIGIYLGYGNGTFSKQISCTTGHINWPTGLDVGHFNDDDYLDFVAAYSGFSGIGVFLGYGNGSFHSPVFYSSSPDENSSPRSIVVDDFNHDTNLDVVIANNFDQNIWIFFGDGTGSFTEQIVYTTLDQSYPQWVSVADLNDDKHLDLIIANYDPSSICILFGYGNGSFRYIMTLSTGEESNPYAIAVGDVNQDQRLDIAVINRDAKNIMIFFGENNGNFSLRKTFLMNSNSDLLSIILDDVNNDTILDILIVDYDRSNSSAAIFYGYGDGNFTTPKIYPTGINSYPKSIALGDFNGDGKIDLAMAYLNHESIGIMLQVRSEPFASPIILPTGHQSQPKAVTIAHFNNDDHLDLVVANSAANTVAIFLGWGNGSFDKHSNYSTGINSLPIALDNGDFNNDHHRDFVVVNTASNNFMIFFGDGNGSFPHFVNYSTGIRSDPSSIAVAYLDRDLFLDLVVTNWGTNNVLVFFGQIDGSLSKPRSYSMGYNARPQSVIIADMNNDHMLDIIIANYGSDYVEILLQNC